MIRRFDEEKGWHEEGAKSCAAWLSWRTGVTPGAARERVRVARALGELPELSEAVRGGELSYSVARALTRVATPENEAELVAVALHSTAAQMERLVSAWKRADRAEAELVAEERERHARRELFLVVDHGEGSWVAEARLDPEVGAAWQKALEAAEDALFRGGAVDEEAGPAARRADAMGLLVEAVPRIEGGPHLCPETARRLACDASVGAMLRDADGSVLDVGRKRRTVPPATRRALEDRDGGCRFPGCGSRFCDAHHVVPWAEGGETSLDNLVLLCRHHHRRVHEDGWSVERVETDAADGAEKADRPGTTAGGVARFRFLRPDGNPLPRVPQTPELGEEPTGDLHRKHADLDLGPWTATPAWEGDRMDVDLALQALSGPSVPGIRYHLTDVSAETSDNGETVDAAEDPPEHRSGGGFH